MKTTFHNHGIVSILAMLFIVVFSSLAAAMAVVSVGNLRAGESFLQMHRSLAAAESGMRVFEYRIARIAETIVTREGSIDHLNADRLWNDLRRAVTYEMGQDVGMLDATDISDRRIVMGAIPVDAATGPPTFRLTLERHPLIDEDYDAPRYQRSPYNIGEGENRFTRSGGPVTSREPIAGYWLRVRSTGRDGRVSRAVELDFRIDRQLGYAVLSRSRLMVGRNVLIEGNVGSTYTLTDFEKGHPIHLTSNFSQMDRTLDKWLGGFRRYLAKHDVDRDNRILVQDEREAGGLRRPEGLDRNSDGYIESYDLFLLRCDQNRDGAVTRKEFSDADGQLIDPDFWKLVHEMKFPQGTEFDWDRDMYRLRGGAWVQASGDFGVIDDDDAYAKVRGRIILAADRESWERGAAQGPYQQFLEDAIVDESRRSPIRFQADDSELPQILPSEFDISPYRSKATGDFESQSGVPTAHRSDQPTSYTPASEALLEPFPYGSATPYDYYARPIYRNAVFRDVLIPKGTNAMFIDCKFIGVTFIDTEPMNTDLNYNLVATRDADGSQRYAGMTAMVDRVVHNDTKAISNNIRFHDCVFEGVLVGEVTEAYTHMRNKLQFTGRTVFTNGGPNVRPERRDLYRRAAILAPQFSIDMDSYDLSEQVQDAIDVRGSIVAGVCDVRGVATIDGSIIATFDPIPNHGPLHQGGSPANFNTTLGYFAAEAGFKEDQVPTGGIGRIVIRYDPTAGVPDGLAGPISVWPDYQTWFEGR